ncbi:MAG: hypothetical protein EPO09_18175 [Aquabacterium sp.]|uniref:hypothetical protein n=1 Tax=Aquabacterium sp. TaxID=1872578 RepID=UPI00120D76BD|nr:hypothetical protein [Aquabacterium sp.]TAK88589.1 MAG: hypothetical protein EPO09_18175 [Aquabacterium sp.]
MTFTQLWRLVSLSLCLILSGCLHMDVVFTVQADGSGTITETTHWPANNPLLHQFGGTLPPMNAARLQALKERARSMGPGVTASEQSQTHANGQVEHTLTFLVPNFNQVHYSLDQGTSQKSHGLQYRFELVRKAGQPSKLTVSNDPFVISLFDEANTPPPLKDAATASANDSLRQFMTTSMQAMAGMAVDIKLALAGEPLKSTAAFQNGQIATLFHMDVDQLMAKPDWQARMFAQPAPRAAGAPCIYADEPGMQVDCQRHIEVWLR